MMLEISEPIYYEQELDIQFAFFMHEWHSTSVTPNHQNMVPFFTFEILFQEIFGLLYNFFLITKLLIVAIIR